jgi:hypothetical protein
MDVKVFTPDRAPRHSDERPRPGANFRSATFPGDTTAIGTDGYPKRSGGRQSRRFTELLPSTLASSEAIQGTNEKIKKSKKKKCVQFPLASFRK